MNITPITRADITAMAHAAAENREPTDAANVFAPGTPDHSAFTDDYFEHMLALTKLAFEV